MLREQGKPVTEFDEDFNQLTRDMLETMYHASGIGLAAQQIGKALMLCVVDVPAEADMDAQGERLNPDINMPLILANPEILDPTEETDGYEEGCLSFPGVSGQVQRPVGITCRYRDINGEACEIQARGLVARAIQHEVDHLNGILFIDHMSSVKRMAISGKLKRLRKEGLAQKQMTAR